MVESPEGCLSWASWEPQPAPEVSRILWWLGPQTRPVRIDGGLSEFLDECRLRPGPWACLAWLSDVGQYALVRDPLGLMPLYWAHTRPHRNLAATTVGAMLAAGVDDGLDYDALALRLAGVCGEERARRTDFSAVKKVPAGHLRLFRPGGRSYELRYWDPAAEFDPGDDLGPRDCAERLSGLLVSAIREEDLPGDGVAGHLSGGLDSAAVVAAAAGQVRLSALVNWVSEPTFKAHENSDQRIRAVRTLANAVSAPLVHYPASNEPSWFGRADPHRFPDITGTREAATLPVLRDLGVGTMLSGWDGDSAASHTAPDTDRWLVATGRAEAAARLRQTDLRRRGAHLVPMRAWAGLLWAQFRDMRRTVAGVPLHPWALELLESVSPLAADAARAEADWFGAVRSPRECQSRLLTLGITQARIEAWHEMGDQFGIRYSYPLLNLHLIKACLGFPWQAWRSGGWTRTAFRLSMPPIVPREITWTRGKTEAALEADGGFVPRMQRELSSQDDRVREVAQVADVLWRTTMQRRERLLPRTRQSGSPAYPLRRTSPQSSGAP